MCIRDRSSAVLFTSTYFAEDVRSLNMCSLFLPRNGLPFILPSVISRSKTSFLNTCPNHLCFRCQIVFNMLLSSFDFSRTDEFVTLSIQLIFSILLQIQTLKASNRFLSAVVKSPSLCCIEHHTPDKAFDNSFP